MGVEYKVPGIQWDLDLVRKLVLYWWNLSRREEEEGKGTVNGQVYQQKEISDRAGDPARHAKGKIIKKGRVRDSYNMCLVGQSDIRREFERLKTMKSRCHRGRRP